MVDFFYDNFYQVLSGEGIWVLILIGSGLAVASFILFTMKIEVNPKQNKLNNVIQTGKKEENPVQDKSKKKSKFRIKGRSKTGKNASEGETHTAETTRAMPVRPEVIQPGDIEQVNIEIADPGGFDIPALPDMGDQASPLTDAAVMSPHAEPEDTEAGLSADITEEDGAEQKADTADKENSGEDKNNENTKGNLDTSSIFDIFNAVEDEDSGVSELAKNMEDVTINGLLSDTETLSEELKSIFSKYRRA